MNLWNLYKIVLFIVDLVYGSGNIALYSRDR